MQCPICEFRCHLSENRNGRCQMYEFKNGQIRERFPETFLFKTPVTIETVPLVHFHPKGKFLQIGTIGCNFSCPGCVSEIFASNADEFSRALPSFSVQEIIQLALQEECLGIVFCMNDPTVSHYTFLKILQEAKRHNLLCGCSTNGYQTVETLRELIPYLDFVNVGLKGISKPVYKQCGVPTSQPVFRNIELLHKAGVHVEVSLIYSRHGQTEALKTADAMQKISRRIPFQVMRFIPFGDSSPEQEPSFQETEEVCQEIQKKLSFVYLFNTPGTTFLNTYCPDCGKLLVEREFYGPMGCTTRQAPTTDTCSCGASFNVTGPIHQVPYQEYGLLGGYRITRALAILKGIAGCLGECSGEKMAQLWGQALTGDFIYQMHNKINHPQQYLPFIKEIGELLGCREKASQLVSFITERLTDITTKLEGISRPNVYYLMGSPLFGLNGSRVENTLVETAGGNSLNRKFIREGKPGINLSPEDILNLNPDYIFVSGFISSPATDYHQWFKREKLQVKALSNRQIHIIPTGWDFGSPKWILGIMFIANILHPELFHFDLKAEERSFQQLFFGTTSAQINNRSFYYQPQPCIN